MRRVMFNLDRINRKLDLLSSWVSTVVVCPFAEPWTVTVNAFADGTKPANPPSFADSERDLSGASVDHAFPSPPRNEHTYLEPDCK
ncbi:hypothetical protein CDAR_393501 [Caerostris darwini]|uniref:Uncharacterized protein n=1 Tax=Caerostris darwini TaxID=1538125 RepID=A0AAV4W968_9ARAC|nr:hypothetical protein CDAR_393501 [Caerostris darwini]